MIGFALRALSSSTIPKITTHVCCLQSGRDPSFLAIVLSAQRALSRTAPPLEVQPNGTFFVTSEFLFLRKEENAVLWGDHRACTEDRISDILRGQIFVPLLYVNKNTIQ
ncbi:unnamed protein product [Gulo gulo]|uniref:Uncharacterized protein n=1 Tax=Gulo gulo TaxID=48420 RepID=A0A9X9Q2U3_GULGU|nr:unnamed protein product [Gulo gulo]